MIAFPEAHQPPVVGAHRPVVLLHAGSASNWMWEPQLPAVRDRLALTPHLPGFGERVAEDWPGLAGAADDVARRIRDLGADGAVDVVGLSLGGVVALHLAARHPQLVASLLTSGTAVMPVMGAARALSALQVMLWNRRAMWRAQAGALGLTGDAVERYVEHGLSVRRTTARALLDETAGGAMPERLARYRGRMLLLAGELDPPVIAESLEALREVVPHAETRTAPGVCHIWNIDHAKRFNAMLRDWLRGGVDHWLLEPTHVLL
jgi:pimeloyl-ACP methyl ester carboxylesterase